MPKNKSHGRKAPFNMSRWINERREQQMQQLAQPTSMRDTTGVRSVTGLAPKMHDPETARLIAEWDAKQKVQA